MDNIKIIEPLPSMSSTKRVKPTDHRQNNNQQNLFKKTFKEREKKKNKTKEDPMHDNISGSGATADMARHARHAVTNKKSKESSHNKTIDIRV